MCGIAGWVDWATDVSLYPEIAKDMGSALACRGPDDEGLWLSQRCSLAHRRLVVVDPAGGGQPMVRHRPEGSACVIVYNGELYNTPDIRDDLRAKGWTFQGHSDTEVLLKAYMEWGPPCVERFNGIFAFAIWDEKAQGLFMGRDRLGVKPLFYAQRGSALLFGSELKALLKHPLVHPEVDAEGLAEVFVMGPSRTPGHGVYRGIRELKPGHVLWHDATGTRVTPYWRLESRPHEHDFETSVAMIRQILEDTVERQLVSDVPVCTLLSGGIDSSAVTAFAAMSFRRAGLDALHTYSVDYVDNDRYFRSDAFQPDADGPWARLVSEKFGTQHHVVMIHTGELAGCLPAAVHARDLPGYADIDTSLYLLCREIKKGATVALSGECADEIFGGYPWFRREEDLRAGTFPWMRKFQQRTRLYSDALLDYIRPDAYLERRYHEALDEVPRLPGEDPQAARMREILYLTLTRFMAALLERKDRMSMAVGLEVRVPYCDHRLVEYVWNIPWVMKECDQRGKGILRRALVGVLPQDVLARRKSPYPKTHDPGYLARVRSWMLDILDDPTSPILPMLNVEAVRRFANSDAEEFNIPWYGQLMTGPQLLAYLIQVDTWLRNYRVTIV